MSELVHAVVAGPTLKKLTPAPTTSANAFAPVGVVPSRGGPFANTIGNTGAPFNTTVPAGSSVVTAATALPAHASASTSANGQTKRFSASPILSRETCRVGRAYSRTRFTTMGRTAYARGWRSYH